MKRVIVLFSLVFFVSLSSVFSVYAGSDSSNVLSPKRIKIYLKPDVTVILDDEKQTFRNSEGKIVYPIIYNGSTYLPIRAISGLMNEPIEWDSASKTVFIGRTLSDPGESSITANTVTNYAYTGNFEKPRLIDAYLKPDVLIMYNFVLQTFTDANANIVYPIICNGTTYLPVRAISDLMGEPIEWDAVSKTVTIGDGKEANQDSQKENEISAAAKNLNELFEREEALYYEATAKTTELKEVTSLAEKQSIASEISKNYLNAQKTTTEIKAMNISDFTESEIDAYSKIVAFAESTEYYILVLENIAYLDAQGMDYSMLAETFLYFAMDSQTKMGEARTSIELLIQIKEN